MVTAALLIVILFLGGWHLWGVTGSREIVGWGQALARVLVLLAKVFLVILFMMLVRWTWPRFRFDQLMNLAWKFMLPLGLVNLVVVAVLGELSANGTLSGHVAVFWTILGGWIALAAAALVTALAAPWFADNQPRLDGAAAVDLHAQRGTWR
jgi:NADH-quinone oxidoreductase subunit H